MKTYNIVGRLREASFLSQIIHESGSFRYVREISSGEAYEGRKDLGNIYKGDGARFKGRGLIQITGRTNYEALSKDLGIDFVSNPALLEQPVNAVRSACWFWDKKNLNRFADAGDNITITRRINGGTNGITERMYYYDRALKVL
jgi:Predicted chitinase